MRKNTLQRDIFANVGNVLHKSEIISNFQKKKKALDKVEDVNLMQMCVSLPHCSSQQNTALGPLWYTAVQQSNTKHMKHCSTLQFHKIPENSVRTQLHTHINTHNAYSLQVQNNLYHYSPFTALICGQLSWRHPSVQLVQTQLWMSSRNNGI